MQETYENPVRSLEGEDPLEENMATHSNILAWRIPWTEEPGWLQSMGSQRVRHGSSDFIRMLGFSSVGYKRNIDIAKQQPLSIFSGLPQETARFSANRLLLLLLNYLFWLC